VKGTRGQLQAIATSREPPAPDSGSQPAAWPETALLAIEKQTRCSVGQSCWQQFRRRGSASPDR